MSLVRLALCREVRPRHRQEFVDKLYQANGMTARGDHTEAKNRGIQEPEGHHAGAPWTGPAGRRSSHNTLTLLSLTLCHLALITDCCNFNEITSLDPRTLSSGWTVRPDAAGDLVRLVRRRSACASCDSSSPKRSCLPAPCRRRSPSASSTTATTVARWCSRPPRPQAAAARGAAAAAVVALAGHQALFR